MQKRPLGEFELIGLIKDLFSDMPGEDMEGIGDDCSVIPFSEKESFLISTDMLLEGVHFLTSKIDPYDLGRKTISVNLSDIAAMGGRPVASFLSIGLPADITEEWRERFIAGYKSVSQEFSVPLLGGDTASSKHGIALNVTVIGRTDKCNIKRRGDARTGDFICVAGKLGDSVAGLRLLLSNDGKLGENEKYLIKRHNDPVALVREGEWLGCRNEVHAMMDVSDGIASDLNHILRASDKGAVVDVEKLPVSNALKKVAGERQWDMHELAAAGGEDYALLFTADAEGFTLLADSFRHEFGSDLFIIGKITDSPAITTWTQEGKVIYPEYKGFTHF